MKYHLPDFLPKRYGKVLLCKLFLAEGEAIVQPIGPGGVLGPQTYISLALPEGTSLMDATPEGMELITSPVGRTEIMPWDDFAARLQPPAPPTQSPTENPS